MDDTTPLTTPPEVAPPVAPEPPAPPTVTQRAQAALQKREQATGHVDAHCRALTAAIKPAGSFDQPALVELESIAAGGKPVQL